MAARPECPECHEAVAEDDFQCAHCGLLLDAEQASGAYVAREPTIVRAMLSPPQRTRTLEIPQPPPKHPARHDLATARFTVPMDEHTVPHLRAGLDIALQPLHPFEAHIASFIDGVQPVPELARAARLPEIEVQVVLKALLERGVVELHRPAGAPLPRYATSEMPVLDGSHFLAPEPMALGDEDEDEPTHRPTPPRAPPPRPPAPAPATPPGRGTAPVQTAPAPTPARGTAPVPPARPTSPVPTSTPARGSPPVPPPARGTAPARPPRSPPPLASSESLHSRPTVSVQAPAPLEPLHSRPTVSVPAPAPLEPQHSRPTVSVQVPRLPPRPTQPLEAPPTTSVAPTTPEDFLQRAVRLERQGEVERAIEVLTRAIDRTPDAAALYSKLALVLVHQRKDFARAVPLLERAVELEPNNAVFQQNLLKVTGLAAASGGERKEQKRGLFARLTGRR